MAHLTLVGLSRDKTRLLLVDDAGAEFTLDIDAPLRAAVRGDSARIGQLEIHMESALRPRDIQARIRAGETPETVAEAARTTVERIMVFAAPVLAERAHMADRAQRASVRRRSGEPGARTLGMAVTEQLGAENVAADAVVWDAWRREDGRWTLTGDFASPGRSGGARFSFDPPGNYVVAENDDARWLVGELPPAASRADQTPGVPGRRLAAVSEGDRPLPGTELGDDALELVAEAEEP
ncbi:MAG TPA: septation protein SepH, partial [Nocardioides sp.]|uniref:septation protein SepH n=1 Tax=Nocardioides sp. TaxID=35761 RepID=UPI002C3F937C